MIKTYYGIQLNDCTNDLYKIYADKVYNKSTMKEVQKKPNIIYGINLSSKLNKAGLGEYQLNNSTDYKVLIANNKAYYVPVYINRQIFNTNDINYIEGEYIFDNNQI